MLERSELFRGLGPPALHHVVEAARAVTLQRNDLVFAQDDPAEELFIVRSGRIAIAQRSSDGRQTMVALMEGEDLFGDMKFGATGVRGTPVKRTDLDDGVRLP